MLYLAFFSLYHSPSTSWLWFFPYLVKTSGCFTAFFWHFFQNSCFLSEFPACTYSTLDHLWSSENWTESIVTLNWWCTDVFLWLPWLFVLLWNQLTLSSVFHQSHQNPLPCSCLLFSPGNLASYFTEKNGTFWIWNPQMSCIYTYRCIFICPYQYSLLQATMKSNPSIPDWSIRLFLILFASGVFVLFFFKNEDIASFVLSPLLLVPFLAFSKPTHIFHIKNWASSYVPHISLLPLREKAFQVFNIYPGPISLPPIHFSTMEMRLLFLWFSDLPIINFLFFLALIL